MANPGLGGFKSSSGKVQSERHGRNRRTGTAKANVKSEITRSGDSKSPTGDRVVRARRSADHGGQSDSVMQKMIGGPFMGRSGSAHGKRERMKRLPS